MKNFSTIVLTLTLAFAAAAVYGQQSDRARGIELYKQGNNEEAVQLLEKAALEPGAQADAELWNYLGLAYLKLLQAGKAVAALEKSINAQPANDAYRLSLAYAYLINKKAKKARTEIDKVIKNSPKNTAAYYIRGKINFEDEKYDAAIADADFILAAEPKNAEAHSLKAEALFYKYIAELKKGRAGLKTGYLREAAAVLGDCLKNCDKNINAGGQNARLAVIQAFADAARRKDIDLDEPREVPDPGFKKVKLLSKPRPIYTKEARERGISGRVRVLVLFGADGRIPFAIVVKGVGFGLDEQAIRAVSEIKFEPRMRDGKPVPSVAVLEYGFEIY
jgi:TonB family protein